MRAFDGAYRTNITHSSFADGSPSWQPLPTSPLLATPIQHVVVIYRENRSFDKVLGLFCMENARCDGATTGRLADETIIRPATASDVVAKVAHTNGSQLAAIDNGKMDGFSKPCVCIRRAPPRKGSACVLSG